MKQEVLFGTAYYPEYMPYDRIYKDLKMMSDAGMNTVRIAESTWSTLEPTEGVFHFEYIDRTLDAVEKAGMKAIIGTPTYAIPAWLVKKDQDVMVQTKDGQAQYGCRQIMDITNQIYLECAKKVIEKLIAHTAKRECVIGFQIDNETKHYNTTSPCVQERFCNYLKEKYGTTEELNRAFGLAYWSNSIYDWEDFPDMKGCVNGGLASEFEKFQRTLAAEFLHWQARLVEKYKEKHQFITHNLDFEWKKFGADIAQDGYSYGIQPDIDHSETAQFLTIAGTDIYHPTQDELTGAEIAFCGDEIRGLKMSNYLVLECQAQAFKYWTPYPGQLRLHAYSHLASGAAGLMYWNWHSIHNGYETYWRGVLSHDLDVNPVYEEAKHIGIEWKCAGAENLVINKKNKVAVVVDNHTLTACRWFPIDRDLSYNDVVRWMYDSLFEMNVECDIIHADDFCRKEEALDMSQYAMLITPALYSASDELIQMFQRYVAAGGVLISSFKSFVADRNLTVYHDKQPHGMTACFGMSYNQFTEPGRTKICGQKVQYFAELLKVNEAQALEVYEHPYWKEYAGITSNRYGKGTAYYIGCYTEKSILKEIYTKALTAAGLIENIPMEQWPVIIKSGRNQGGNQLHYVLYYSEERREWNCPYDYVKDVLSGKGYRKNDQILLKDWDVLVLEESVKKTY